MLEGCLGRVLLGERCGKVAEADILQCGHPNLPAGVGCAAVVIGFYGDFGRGEGVVEVFGQGLSVFSILEALGEGVVVPSRLCGIWLGVLEFIVDIHNLRDVVSRAAVRYKLKASGCCPGDTDEGLI